MIGDSHTDRRWTRNLAAVSLAVLALTGAACSSSSSTTTTTSNTKHLLATGVVGKRYCEVLLVHPGTGGLVADVYNTYPLNACPEAQWAAEDASSIAKENGALVAELNGPRFWLMNSIAKVQTGPQVTKSFGGMAMIMQATVVIGTNIAAARAPYTTHAVDRQAAFTFNTGRQVYELIDPTGQAWVMQTLSQITDPTLSQADLPGLASRLTLPAGWTYRARTLTKPLVVATIKGVAHVLQDNFENSYSMETSP